MAGGLTSQGSSKSTSSDRFKLQYGRNRQSTFETCDKAAFSSIESHLFSPEKSEKSLRSNETDNPLTRVTLMECWSVPPMEFVRCTCPAGSIQFLH